MPRILRSSTRQQTENSSVQTKTKGNLNRRHPRRSKASFQTDSDDDLNPTLPAQRPFELISSLPASISEPDYNAALTHPLSVRDSAVLYSALIASRKTWISGEMFDTYWVRPTSTPPLPPPPPQGLSSSGSKGSQTDDRGQDQRESSGIKDKMLKMCDCVMCAGPHRFKVRLFILKDEAIERRWLEKQENLRQLRIQQRIAEEEERRKKIEMRKELQEQKKREKMEQAALKKELRLKAKLEQQRKKEEAKKLREEQKLLKKQMREKKKQEMKELRERKKEELRLMRERKKQEKIEEKLKKNTPKARHARMIANLNYMAQQDQALGTLMAKVAGGSATEEEIEKFKGIIEIAKKLPPPPPKIKLNEQLSNEPLEQSNSEKLSTIPSTPSLPLDPTVEPQATSPEPKVTSMSEDNEAEPSIEPTTSVAQSVEEGSEPSAGSDSEVNMTHEDSVLEEKEPAQSPLEQDEDLTNTDSVTPASTGTAEVDIKMPSEDIDAILHTKRKYKKRKIKSEQSLLGGSLEGGDWEEEKLTAFQQKYIDESELILEYLEDTNSRFYLPRDCIIEYDDASEKFILSWITIHNKKDIEKFAKRKKLKDTNDALQLNECPEPLFSALTVTLEEVPRRFTPIILHSVLPEREVQERMKRILDIGIRLSGYHLWYQLDGYDDSELAENLRIGLNTYENSMRNKRGPRKLAS